MLYLVSKETISRLKTYVANGGTIVMTYISGIVNEYDLTYLGGWHTDLQEIFGIKLLETDTLYPKDRNSVRFKGISFELKDYATVVELKKAKAEGHYENDFYANTPAVTSNLFEKGKAFYIGGRLEDAFHREFYQTLIKDLSLEPAVSVKHDRGVSVQVRQAAEYDYIFVMNFTEEKQSVTFDSLVKDMITDEELIGEVILEKYEVKIVEKHRAV